MSKSRKKIPAQIKRHIIIESGNRCSMPHCLHETGLEIHHIDGNPINNEITNLLLLCAVHHSQVTKGDLDKLTCQVIKHSLISNSSPIYLNSRSEFVKIALMYLKSSSSYRNIAAGPFLLSPDWYWNRRDEVRSIPNFDKALFDFVLSNSKDRNHDIRLMFSLSSRYVEKINALIKVEEREIFVNAVIEKIKLLFGSGSNHGPDVCCYHSGHSNIDMIFDDAVISTYRLNQNSPTATFILNKNTYTVGNVVTRFDNIFDANSKGQKHEVNKLINFIKNLWAK